MPVGVIPCQPGHLQTHDDACPPHSHIGHQELKSFAPRRRGAGFTLIAVDDSDLVVTPAKGGRTTAKSILPLCALDVLEDLSHRRLPNVEISAPFEMMRLNLESFMTFPDH